MVARHHFESLGKRDCHRAVASASDCTTLLFRNFCRATIKLRRSRTSSAEPPNRCACTTFYLRKSSLSSAMLFIQLGGFPKSVDGRHLLSRTKSTATHRLRMTADGRIASDGWFPLSSSPHLCTLCWDTPRPGAEPSLKFFKPRPVQLHALGI